MSIDLALSCKDPGSGSEPDPDKKEKEEEFFLLLLTFTNQSLAFPSLYALSKILN